MVDQHGSQCGFCTPGFVMSLLALSKGSAGGSAAEASALNARAVCDAIAGNLCRCTGYRPIVESAIDASAASDALDRGLDDVFDRRESQTIAALEALDVAEELTIESHGRTYLAPTSMQSLATAYTRQTAPALLSAGSTDVWGFG